MFVDYSTLLMQIEQATKRLSENCLHQRYEGYLADIASVHSNLSMLAAWFAQEKQKKGKSRE